ncbi:MAG: polysaccharide biosynthesis protein [Rhodospirillaceae bacterium]|nr:polysaccharide biosynthesis protein [Rhodospirillaceae bacterium]
MVRRLFQPRNLLVYGHDVVMAFAAFLAAFFLRLGPDFLNDRPVVFPMAATFAAVAAAAYLFTGLYRHVWEYVSAKDAVNIVRTATVVVLVFLPAWFFVARLESLPRSLPFISWFVLVMFLAGPRLLCRMLKDPHARGIVVAADAVPILLIGAGPEAEYFIRKPSHSYRIVGMVTARGDRVGQVIQGVEVLGRNEDLVKIVAGLDAKGLKPHKLILVGRDVDGAAVQKLLELAAKAGCPLERVRVDDGNDLKPQPIAIEDLLGRPQSNLDRAAMAAMIRRQRILVTGAGGSIGAELVRQISATGPAHLTLVDNGEFNLYSIDLDVRQRHAALSCTAILADVRDGGLMKDIIARERPDIVFHAAALKHVPMVELNPLEGLLTNAIGARNVADACVAAGVKTAVMISTDKAVNPSNVMGASKRVAEIYCQAMDLRGLGTRFITVRFGNVLGSAGSVVPLFQRQLAAGGALTVTHPDIERYFMTVHEAVELVLEAAALGPGRQDEGAIYVLDMGTPIKIVDLARQMILLAGKTPGTDVAIQVTGLRPGEKLSEELFHVQEPTLPTDMAGVLLARPRTVDHAVIAAKMAALDEACRRRDEPAALALVADLVPELRRGGAGQAKAHLKVIK